MSQRPTNEQIIARLDIKREYELLGAVFTNKSRGDWFQCHAVGREDRNPSAWVNVTSGRYRDFASGARSESLFDVSARIGKFGNWTESREHYASLTGLSDNPTALPSSRKKPKKQARGFPTPEAAIESSARHLGMSFTKNWIYPDAGGFPLRAARFDPPPGDDRRKIFRPLHRGEDGLWRATRPPVGLLPIYASDRREFVEALAMVWVEGEKCADALWNLGIPATCNFGGAAALKNADLSKLAGKKSLAVFPDRDAGGQALSEQVASAAFLMSLTVKIVDLPGLEFLQKPGKPVGVGVDVYDWIESRDAQSPEDIRDELLAIVSESPVWKPPTKTPAVATNDWIDQPILTYASAVQDRDVEWLWLNRIPAGMISQIAGDSKQGKSLITFAIAASVTAGVRLPDKVYAPRGSAIVLLGEDPEFLAKQRLRAAGADLGRVAFLSAVETRRGRKLISLDANLLQLEMAISQVSDCKIVIIDPITAFVGSVDDHKNAELRRILSPLSDLADRTGVAVVLLNHTNKAGKTAKTSIMGSTAYVATSRANYIVLPDPQDPDRRLFLENGCNLSPSNIGGLAYRVVPWEENPKIPRLVWEDSAVTISADEALASFREEKAAKAKGHPVDEWLINHLSNGPVAKESVLEAGQAAGFSKSQINRAAGERVKVQSNRREFSGAYFWSLPDSMHRMRRMERMLHGVSVPAEHGPTAVRSMTVDPNSMLRSTCDADSLSPSRMQSMRSMQSMDEDSFPKSEIDSSVGNAEIVELGGGSCSLKL